jgi:acetyl esterase/lipase
MPSDAHEALVAALGGPHAWGAEVFTPEAIALQRAEEAREKRPSVDGVTVTDVDAGGVPAIWVTSLEGPVDRTVLYFHGGAYISFTPDRYVPTLGKISRATQSRCLAIHYRRAPEHPFPAPVDDAVTAYRWLLDQGIDASEIVFAGDSAGGGLVLCALVALRDQHVPLPAGGICVSPWTDLTISGASATSADDPIVSGAQLKLMADVYLAGQNPREPLASPLFADLSGLPPLQVQVGSRESLLDDARRIVERARTAGVDVTYDEYQGVIHMWTLFGPELPESRQAFELMGTFVGAFATGG